MSNRSDDAPESGETGNSQLDEQTVADYLRRHAGFFQDKPALLADMRIPHDTGDAVSLVERQIAALRESAQRQQKQLDGLIGIARENDRLNQQLHRLILGIFECGNLGDLLDLVALRLQEDFSADMVAIRLLSVPMNKGNKDRPELVKEPKAFQGLFQHLLSAGKPYCGRLKAEQLEALFSQHADAVGSVALLPLGEKGKVGLLAICSYNESRFQSGADTAFLVRMTEVIAAVLSCYLKEPG